MKEKNKTMPKKYFGFFKCLLSILFLFAAEACFIGVMIINFNVYWLIALCGLHFFGIVAAIEIIGRKNLAPSTRRSWLFFVLAFSPLGFFIYAFFGDFNISAKKQKRLKVIDAKCDFNIQSFDSTSDLDKNDCKMIASMTGYYHYENSSAEFLNTGEAVYDDIKNEISKAQKFIFIEIHYIASGKLLNEISRLLIQKVKQGVDVRVIYDHTVSHAKFFKRDRKALTDGGVKLAPYKNTMPLTLINLRNHRKIVSIDGRISYNLCCNMSDEYVNIISPYGYWKDCGVKIQGQASDNLTFMFLKMWDSLTNSQTEYTAFLSVNTRHEITGETVLPFCESAFNLSNPFKSLIKNLIYNARKTLTITSPFYILEEEIVTSLLSAAARGVEIRLALPSVSSNKTVQALSLSTLTPLINAKIKVYSYTPGMLHSKTIISDGIRGMISSVNLNHRSFYLDYECGVYMANSSALTQAEQDFSNNIVKKSYLLKSEDMQVSAFQKFATTVASLFSIFF